MTQDIERTSLDAHVSMCELRYQALNDRLTRVETQLTDLQTLVLEIRDRLQEPEKRMQAQQHQAYWWTIGILLAALAVLVQRYVLPAGLV
jgi:predicted  nucleic acid-binding Zn-ribbon protein